ncbi:MAG TPA: WD40 repeat domain-containing protein [Chitinophagaceae bacterium]|jgi:WD40 repeat protein|nr:WD40 domain-containing protein [Chitinophagaceae bacterium]HMZ46770.1 WD40 repeat domain-containing protein [Chitinophagaceae bacterium]HNE94295.1 WD40 repeat domain-containing protein [Chitinophagaceae bacterium]HNF30099.1 WD40 repeat domain-containing protein [Chitinophagaceae bacterium]HNJ58545.1 WD40 repeat domain-containing protein [Chitinophagaceae bacterium]
MRYACLIVLFFILFFLRAQEPTLVTLIGHSETITLTKFSPNERLMLTASEDALYKLNFATTGNKKVLV